MVYPPSSCSALFSPLFVLGPASEFLNRHRFISLQSYHKPPYCEKERKMLPLLSRFRCELHSLVTHRPWRPGASWNERITQRDRTDNCLKSLIRSKETGIDKAIVDRVKELAKKRGVSKTMAATA